MLDLRNALTKHQADELYEPLHPVVRRDLLDNNSDYIVVGNTTIDRKIVLDYSYELPIANKAITGRLTLSHDGNAVNVDDDYSFLDYAVVNSVTMGAVVVGNEIRWTIVTSDVGENPTVQYRRLSIGVV